MKSFRRILYIAILVCVSVVVIDLIVIFTINNKCISGAQLCAQDLDAAKAFGFNEPGITFSYDCETGLAVVLPSSKAMAMVCKGIFDPAYNGQAACAWRALIRHIDGLIFVIFVFSTILILLIKLVLRLFK
jgi:hypothetical protein